MVKASCLIKHQGFTLIELLIVISIIGVGLTLVGGLGIEQRDKAAARTELLELESDIKSFSHKAFHRSDVVYLNFSSNQLVAEFKHLENATKTFYYDYLEFPQQKIFFNQAGLPDKLFLQVSLNGQEIELELYRLIGFKKEDAYAEPAGF